MSSKINFDQQSTQTYYQFKPILADYKIIKNLSPLNHEDKLNSEFSNLALRLTINLHPFLINLVDKSEHEKQEFLSNFNDVIKLFLIKQFNIYKFIL